MAHRRPRPPPQPTRSPHDCVPSYWSDDHPRLETLEFSRGRKSMSVLVGSTAGRTRRATANTLLVKGAPESVLDRCTRIK